VNCYFDLVEASADKALFQQRFNTNSSDSLIRTTYEKQFHVNFWNFHHAVFKPKNEMLKLREKIEEDRKLQLENINAAVLSAIVLVLLLAALLFTHLYFHITKSITRLVNQLMVMTQGKLVQIEKVPKDEIGEVMHASNKLVASLGLAREFALQIGRGNFAHHFKPSTEHDALGISLVQMRDELARQREEITNQYQELAALNDKLEEQRDKLEEQRDKLSEQNRLIEEQNIELRGAKENLEETVQERTQELTRQNMQLEQFAYMTAHNLRSPVDRLLGLTSIFNFEEQSDPVNKTVIEQIRRSAMDFDEVLKDISVILEVRKGAEQHFTVLSFQLCYDKAKAMLQTEFDLVQPLMKLHLHGTSIKGIDPYATSIFYNLLSNSLKFKKENERLSINITAETRGNKILLIYTDNGIGIDLDKAGDKLFQPFKRFTNHAGGKGLGLYLIRLQTEAMGGTVTLQSSPNEGVEFQFLFHALNS